MKRIYLTLITIICSITTHANTHYSPPNHQQANGIDTSQWLVIESRKDSQGAIRFYQRASSSDSGFTRTFRNGKSFSYLSTTSGQFAGLGDISTKTLAHLKDEKNRYDIQKDIIKPSITPKLLVDKYKAKSSAQITHSNFDVTDTDISITMVLDTMAIKIAMERGEVLGLSLNEQLQAAVDITNLALVNSGITAFTVSLGAVITVPAWEDTQALQETLYGDTVNNDIGIAILEGKADRIAFFVDPEFTGTFLGLAKQWYFKDDDENQGILNTSFDDRTMQISARVLVTNVLAHEFGHTLGLGHERATQHNTVDYAIPYGYTSPNGVVSIMSYGSECQPNCQAFPTLYSNPNISQDGFALGVPKNEENAADAASFITRTWPMTTQASYDLTPVDVKHFATTNTLMWTPPANLNAQTLYTRQGSCPDVPSPYEAYQLDPTVEDSYTVVSLDGETSAYEVSETFADHCVIIVGEFSHFEASLQRVIGMVATGQNNNSDRFNLSSNVLEFKEGIAQFDITLANSSADNAAFVVQVPDIWQYNDRLSKWQYVNLSDSPLNDMVDVDVQGEGTTRSVTLTVDEYRLIEFVYKYGLHGEYMTGRLPFRLAFVSETYGFLASQYAYIDVRKLLLERGNITVSHNALSFKNDTAQALIVTFTGINNVSELSAMRLINGELIPIEESRYTIENTSDKTYEMHVTVQPPSTESEQLVFSTAALPFSKTVVLQKATWPYIANVDDIPRELPTNTYSTFGITITNPSLSDYTSFAVYFSASCNSGNEVLKRNEEVLSNGDYYFSITLRSDISRDCNLAISRFEGNTGWQIYETDIRFVDTGANLASNRFDFNGDKASDLAIWQDNSFITRSSVGGAISRSSVADTEVIPLIGDFDGDQVADFAYFTPKGEFYFKSSYSTDWRVIGVPAGNVEPVVGDFNGDGRDDFAVRNRDNGLWTIHDLRSNSMWQTVFGNQPGDFAVVADYDGDGTDDFAIRRTTSRLFIIKESSTGNIRREYFGAKEEDLPVVADYDGDGKADIGVRRPSRKQWYIKYSSNNKIYRTGFGGQTTDIPIPADYDGDGRADIAVRRPSSSYQFIYRSSDKTIERTYFGSSTLAIPLTLPVGLRSYFGTTDLSESSLNDFGILFSETQEVQNTN